MSSDKGYKFDTSLMHLGRDPDDYYGFMNSPIVRGSTVKYPSLEAYEDPAHPYRYGRYETPLSNHFCGAIAALEKGYGALPTPSGLSAVTTALLSFLKTGDHVLVVDCIYPPTRDFCDDILPRYGVEVEYFDSSIGGDIERLIRENTAVIYMESPGSATYDIQDVPAIVKVAKAHNIITMIDNSWASGYLYQPLTHGINISILSATKYISGHSDVMLGAVVADTEEHFKILKATHKNLGLCVGAEDMYLALRGLRTLPVRMKAAQEAGLKVAQWLQGRAEVARVFHPALEDDPNHMLWKRDFSGCNGLVTIELVPAPKEKVTAFVEALALFPLGSSWGGYESLLQPQYLKKYRTVKPLDAKGAVLRFQIGLEDVDDLIVDLEQAFAAFNGHNP